MEPIVHHKDLRHSQGLQVRRMHLNDRYLNLIFLWKMGQIL